MQNQTIARIRVLPGLYKSQIGVVRLVPKTYHARVRDIQAIISAFFIMIILRMGESANYG